MNYPLAAAVASYVIGDRMDHDAILPNEHLNVWPPSNAGQFGDRIEGLLAAYPDAAHLANLNLLDSHDTARFLTLASDNKDLLVLALVLTLTFPGAPCIYYGTEVGLAGAVSTPTTVGRCHGTSQEWDADLLATVKELTTLRHEHPALRSMAYARVGPPNGADWGRSYAFMRSDGVERLLIAVNPSDGPDEVPIDDVAIGTRLSGTASASGGALTLPGRSYGVWSVD